MTAFCDWGMLDVGLKQSDAPWHRHKGLILMVSRCYSERVSDLPFS